MRSHTSDWSRSSSHLGDGHLVHSGAVALVRPLEQVIGHHLLDVGWDQVPLTGDSDTVKVSSQAR